MAYFGPATDFVLELGLNFDWSIPPLICFDLKQFYKTNISALKSFAASNSSYFPECAC